MFFIRYALQDLAGKWFYGKQKFSIFFQALSPTNTYRTETFG